MIEAALKYASRGLLIFPIVRGAKSPLTEHGVKDASCDREQIRAWWRQYPNANVGLAAGVKSNLIVLDYDIKRGKRGFETRASLKSRFAIDTLTQGTPSGGAQELFRYVPGLRNSVEILPGVDIRTDGGYVLLPPSVVDGRPYRWTNIVAPAELPAELLAMLTRPKPEPPRPMHLPRPAFHTTDRQHLLMRVQRYLAHVPPAIEGQGGWNHTWRLACKLALGFELRDSEALDALSEWNAGCQPPWSEQELIAKIHHARKYGKEPVGGRLVTP